MSIRRLLKVPHIICAALAIGVPCLAQAYDDDTHFVFTFLAARASGYSPIQASRIASACVEIDSELNENTEPKQLKRTLVDMLTGYGGKDAVTGYRIRRDFHAMLDQARFPESVITGKSLPRLDTKARVKFLEEYNKARAAVRNQGQALENDLRNASIDNPGVLLHFLQDAYAHDGYGTYWGHYDVPSKIDPMPLNVMLPFGSRTDFLSFDPARDASTSDFMQILKRPAGRNEQMAVATVEALKRWLPRGQVFRQSAMRDASKGLEQLAAANPFSTAIVDSKLSPDIGKAVISANQVLDRFSLKRLSLLDRKSVSLNSETKLKRQLFVPTKENRKQLALTGSIKVSIPAKEAASATVKVYFDPELRDVEPYVIQKASTLGIGRNAYVVFENVPLGKLRIEIENSKNKKKIDVNHESNLTNISFDLSYHTAIGLDRYGVYLKIFPKNRESEGITLSELASLTSMEAIIDFHNSRKVDEKVPELKKRKVLIGGKLFPSAADDVAVQIRFEDRRFIPTGEIELVTEGERRTVGRIKKYLCKALTDYELNSGLGVKVEQTFEMIAIEDDEISDEGGTNIDWSMATKTKESVVCSGEGSLSQLITEERRLRKLIEMGNTSKTIKDYQNLDDALKSVKTLEEESGDVRYIGIGGISGFEEYKNSFKRVSKESDQTQTLDDQIDLFSTSKSSSLKSKQNTEKEIYDARYYDFLEKHSTYGGFNVSGPVRIKGAYLQDASKNAGTRGNDRVRAGGLKTRSILDLEQLSGLDLQVRGKFEFVKRGNIMSGSKSIKYTDKEKLDFGTKSHIVEWKISEDK